MNDDKVTVFVQARTGSSRLPGKVLKCVNGREILLYMMERLQRAKTVDKIVVVTTESGADDAIVDICKRANILFFRGSENDLLDRHYKAALEYGAKHVSKIPSDCPLIDTAVVDMVLGYYLDNQFSLDYVSNLHPATFPDGQDVEVCPLAVLERAWKEASRPFEREHTFPYIWDQPSVFRLGNIKMPNGENLSMKERWTLDYKEDFEVIKAVIDGLYKTDPEFGINKIIDFLDEHPEIRELNKAYIGVNWYRKHMGELKTVTAEDTRTSPGESKKECDE